MDQELARILIRQGPIRRRPVRKTGAHKLPGALFCFSLLALCAARAGPQQNFRATAQSPASVAGAETQKAPGPGASPSRTAAQSHATAETPMATDERLEIPGWWPTKGTASRQDFAATAECARCHSKKTVTQLTTPMAHASSAAGGSEILREHEKISHQLGPYAYTISRSDSGSLYSVSDGTKFISEPLLWAFGLGNKGQT